MMTPPEAVPTTIASHERALVVGGNGFVGSYIVDALLASGRSVRVLAPRPERFRPPNPQVEYVRGRLDLDTDLEQIIRDCDIVIDAATAVFPASADHSPAATIARGIGDSARLAEICRTSDRVKILVYLSSGGTVYGRNSGRDRPSLETDALAPIGVYGALKAGAELAVAALLDASPVRAVFLRVANAYGERQDPAHPQGIIPVAFDRLRSGRPLTMYGDTVRDYIHASDVASALVSAIDSETSGPVNVGSGVGVSLASLLATLEEVAGGTLNIERLPARDFDVPYVVLDIRKALASNWAPNVGLEEGLRRTWDWINVHGVAT